MCMTQEHKNALLPPKPCGLWIAFVVPPDAENLMLIDAERLLVILPRLSGIAYVKGA